MNINWSTVFFQIINFLIIIWILKKYLFKPVLSSMDKREQIIQDKLLEAKEAKFKAEKEYEKLKMKIHSLEREKNNIMANTYKKADIEYATLLKTFNAEMAGKRNAFEEQMIMEREFLRHSIKDMAGKTIIKTVQDALTELANTNIQSAIIQNFINQIYNKNFKKINDLKKYYEKEKYINIYTSFEIDENSKKEIINAFTNIIEKQITNINFVINNEIICGIEVSCPPLLISFGMNTYINELTKNIDNGLAKLTKTKKIEDEEK